MSYDTSLTRKFRDMADTIGYYLEEMSHDEERIERIDNNDWSIQYIGVLYKFIIGIIYFFIAIFVCAIIDRSWWVNIIGAFVTLVFVEALIVAPIIKGKAKKRIEVYQNKINQLKRELDDLIEDRLLPEIYPLGMMTAKNIIDKTSARYLPIECVEDFMDQEVKRGNFTRIKLKNDILYKGTLPQSMENIETVVLEVD